MLTFVGTQLLSIEQNLSIQPQYRGSPASAFNIATRLDAIERATYRAEFTHANVSNHPNFLLLNVSNRPNFLLLQRILTKQLGGVLEMEKMIENSESHESLFGNSYGVRLKNDNDLVNKAKDTAIRGFEVVFNIVAALDSGGLNPFANWNEGYIQIPRTNGWGSYNMRYERYALMVAALGTSVFEGLELVKMGKMQKAIPPALAVHTAMFEEVVRAVAFLENRIPHRTWWAHERAYDIGPVSRQLQADLLVAASSGDSEFVQQLLNAGADKNAKSKENITPLIAAAKNDHAEVVKLLLEAGADKNAVDSNGKTALDAATVHDHSVVVNLLQG